jgi:biotin transport system substrate-specific component
MKMSDKRKRTNLTTITQIALFSALLCIISPFAIVFPFSPVPVSLSTLMLYLSVYILGMRNAVISCGIYLLIGSVGIPVFSGFTGGIGKVLGPTGGYLIGYLFLVFISGWFVEKWSLGNAQNAICGSNNYDNGKFYIKYIVQGLGMILGTVVCYLFGSVWIAYQAGMDFLVALGIGTIPFIPGDVLKIFIGIFAGNAVRRRLIKAGMI